MIALCQLFDWCAVLREERQSEVARVVHRGRWHVDLFARFWLTAVHLQLVESCRWDFDSVDEQCAFVSVDEVDTNLGLTQHLLVVRR